MSREVEYDETATCDVCGSLGGFDLMGDVLCNGCLRGEPMPPDIILNKAIGLLKEALDGRASDYVDVEYPGWYKRAHAFLAEVEWESETGLPQFEIEAPS